MYEQDERTEYWEMHSKYVSDLCSAKVLEENQGALGMAARRRDMPTENNRTLNDV